MKHLKSYESEADNNWIANVVLQKAKELNIDIIDIDNKKYIKLYHGTNKKNLKKILRTGKFNNGTWFTHDFDTAKTYSLMSDNTDKPTILTQYICIDSLLPSGNFFVAKKEVFNDKYGSAIYESKSIKPRIGDYVIIDPYTGFQEVEDWILNHIGQIIGFEKKYDGEMYIVEYENIPKGWEGHFSYEENGPENIRKTQLFGIEHFAKNKKELELKLAQNKYNI
jgi:hypothetical protein